MNKTLPFFRSGVLCVGLMTSSVFAQEINKSQWGIGAIVSSEKIPYSDFDDKAEGLPLLLYENRVIRFVGTTLDWKLHSSETSSFGLRLRYSGEGYEAKDSPFLRGMEERHGGVWAGGYGGWNTSWAKLSAEVLADASGESGGTRLSFGLERSFASGNFEFTPYFSTHFLDGKYVDYYYGVQANEATSARAAYLGKSTLNLQAGLRVDYALTPKQRLSLDLSTTRLGTEIKNSPIVDRSRQNSVRLGYLYLF